MMNTRDKKLLTEMLKHMEFWQPIKDGKLITGYSLKLNHVYTELHNVKQVLFYDQIYFPRTQRIMRLIKEMGIVPEHVGWQELEVGMNEGFLIWYPCEVEWQECLSDRFEPYFQIQWDEWLEDQPSEDEILALGIWPDSLAAIQEKLF